MAAGFAEALTKATINQVIGRIAVQLRETFELVDQFDAWHAGVGSAGLQADFNFTSTDAAVVGSVITDFKDLEQIYHGAQALASVYDFRTWSDDVEGLR
jgi:hypothetical protein